MHGLGVTSSLTPRLLVCMHCMDSWHQGITKHAAVKWACMTNAKRGGSII